MKRDWLSIALSLAAILIGLAAIALRAFSPA